MPPESPEHVIRVSRSDESGGFVLVNISSTGPDPLDLRLLATEGENPYEAESSLRFPLYFYNMSDD